MLVYVCFVPKRHRAVTNKKPVIVTSLADKIGLKLSAKACFDPTAAPECVF